MWAAEGRGGGGLREHAGLHGTSNLGKTIGRKGDTLEAICVRYYGRTEGVVEAELAANTG
ncbi:tail protein X, partial [Salmonella enterica]|uniref:tail protein X n=1 Tax=Salmonella enterica TaxID=28901 RepID=UPI00398C36BC